MKNAVLFAMISLLGGCMVVNEPAQVVAASPGVKTSNGSLPTDIRRVTMIVRNMENSLKLYRDVMGLKVNYDAVLPMSGVALPAGEPGAKALFAALASSAISLRARPYSGWPADVWSLPLTPLMPSMSTEM